MEQRPRNSAERAVGNRFDIVLRLDGDLFGRSGVVIGIGRGDERLHLPRAEHVIDRRRREIERMIGCPRIRAAWT
jgi:hypothetical protein